MALDAYVRIAVDGLYVYCRKTATSSYQDLLFVDLGKGATIEQIRDLSRSILERYRLIIVRNVDGKEFDLPERIKALASRARWGTIEHGIGQEPSVTGDEPLASSWRRARTVELEALLSWGRAMRVPANHHYLLPSGQHTPVLFKVGDAIREPRDAEVIAYWLLNRASDGAGLLIDIASLSSVAIALENLLIKRNMTLGPVQVLEHYPKTLFDVQRAVRHSIDREQNLISLISVNGSGKLRDLLAGSLQSYPGMVKRWSIDILVNVANSGDGPNVENWYSPKAAQVFSDFPDKGFSKPERLVFENDCPLCTDYQRSVLVPVDPITFDLRLPNLVERLTPDPKDAHRNSKFWDLCSQAGAIGLDESPDEHAKAVRPDRMPIRIRWSNLLKHDPVGLASAAKSYLKAEHLAADLILVVDDEQNLEGFKPFLEGLVPDPKFHPVVPGDEWEDITLEKVRAASNILVLVLGVVSGVTLQRMLVRVQNCRKDYEYGLKALAVHARPENQRDWQTLNNSFRLEAIDCLAFSWLSYLPNWSPLAMENAILSEFQGRDESFAAFYEQRLHLSGGGSSVDSIPLFWGSRVTDRLSPHSIFGDRMSAVATYVAVASAMESQRSKTKPPPGSLVFDLRAITRSYYDPLILSSMLRWLRPNEAWWGSSLDSSERVLGELLARAESQHQLRILVPELLLATAQGKIPSKAVPAIIEYGKKLLDSDFAHEVRPAILLGMKLVEASIPGSLT